MSNKELLEIYGGVSFSAALLNAIIKAGTTIYGIGKRLGESILRNYRVC